MSETDVWTVKANKTNAELLYYSHVAQYDDQRVHDASLRDTAGTSLSSEFSEKGNAAYIFRFDQFEAQGVNLRTHRFELKSHLKFDRTHRILHLGDWESDAGYRLASEFGIRP